MQMMRIYNNTTKTLVVTYGKGIDDYFQLKRKSVTAPLPSSHPVFLDPGVLRQNSRGVIGIYTEEEWQTKAESLRAKAKLVDARERSQAQKMVEHAKAVKKAEEHNRRVQEQERVEKIMRENLKGDVTAETLVEEEKLEKIEVPKDIEKTKAIIRYIINKAFGFSVLDFIFIIFSFS